MGEMAAGIAHEINQPLSAIATYAQAARRILERDQPGDDDCSIDMCRKIDEQALRAGRVIETCASSSQSRTIGTEPLDVNAVVDGHHEPRRCGRARGGNSA